MIEEEPYFEPEQADGMLYDFAKFMTTLSLIVLGGMLSLTEAAGHLTEKDKNVVISLIALMTLACLLSISAAGSLAKVFHPRWNLGITPKMMLKAAVIILSLATGGFMLMWQRAL